MSLQNSTDSMSGGGDGGGASGGCDGGGRKRRSWCSHSCGRWSVDADSFPPEVLQDVGLSLLTDGHDDDRPGLPTPPDSQPSGAQQDDARSACRPLQDPYLVDTDGYIPEGFLVYKRRKTASADHLLDPFCFLSNEILLKILRLLPKSVLVRCARVCRRWHQMAFDETLWRRVDAAGRCLQAGALGRLLARGCRTLRLARAEISSPVFTGSSVRSQLVFLDLSMANIPAQGLADLLGGCWSLQKLSLERCELSDACCAAVGQNGRLTTLNLALASGVTADGLAQLLAGCQRLEELNLAWTGLARSALARLAAAAPASLLRLNLSGTRDQLTGGQLRQLLRRVGGRLRTLDLSDNTALAQDAFDALMEHLTDVRQLALSRCYSIPAVSCLQLGRLTTLTHMEMYNCFSAAGEETLRRQLPRLTINSQPLSTVARPTVGTRRTSIWEQRVRD